MLYRSLYNVLIRFVSFYISCTGSMSSSGDSGMQPDNDDPLDLQLLDNDVPLLAYVGGVGALLLIISVSMCTTVLCVYYRKNRWGNRSQPNTKGIV